MLYKLSNLFNINMTIFFQAFLLAIPWKDNTVSPLRFSQTRALYMCRTSKAMRLLMSHSVGKTRPGMFEFVVTDFSPGEPPPQPNLLLQGGDGTSVATR